MAKKPGPVAGSLGNTEYYYKSDGTVVDESGVPASARITAMFSAPPPVEEAAKVRAPKKLKKNNAQLAGVFSNTKYYYAPDGSVIDDQGKPAPEKFAKMFPPHEKREAIANAMPKAPGVKAADKATGVPSKVVKQFNRNISIATNLITTNQKIMESYPKLFEQMSGVVQKMTEQNEAVIRSVIQNNQEFQDKVIETLTGVKTPTQAGGSVAPKPGRKGAGRKSLKAGRSAAVLSRAKGIKQAKSGMSVGAAIGLAVAGAAAVGVGAALINGAGNVPISDYNGPGVSATGSAREAITFFEGKGWTKAQAIGIAANIEAESKFKTNAVGDGGKAYGVAQWHPDRQRKFQEVYGKNIREANFQEQLEYVNWELNNTEKRAGAMIRQTQNAATAAAAVDQYYERSSGAHRQIRINLAQKYERGEGLATQTTPVAPAGPTTTPAAATTGAPERRPSATPEEAAQYNNDKKELDDLIALEKRKGGFDLGPEKSARKKELEAKTFAFRQKISIRPMQQAGTVTPLIPGSQPGQPIQAGTVRPLDTTGAGPIGDLSNILPSGNIVALGKALQTMGISVSEHPAFGPVGQHSPGSAHYSGRAIDVNGPPGIIEANDPVWGPKFDKLAESMRASGYKVIWRSAGHFNHLHAQIGGADGDMTPVPGAPAPDYYAGGNSRVASASQGYAMDRNAAACACPPTIINNTIMNDNIRTIFQPPAMQINRNHFGTPFNQSAYAAGAAIGGLLRRLF